MKGVTIGMTDCPSCGAELPMKVNSAGCVYFYCARVLGTNPSTGKPEKCLTRLNIGRTGSQKIIQQYKATKEEITSHVELAPAIQPEAGHEPAAAIEPEPAPEIAGNGDKSDTGKRSGLQSWFG